MTVILVIAENPNLDAPVTTTTGRVAMITATTFGKSRAHLGFLLWKFTSNLWVSLLLAPIVHLSCIVTMARPATFIRLVPAITNYRVPPTVLSCRSAIQRNSLNRRSQQRWASTEQTSVRLIYCLYFACISMICMLDVGPRCTQYRHGRGNASR
jgi:hypothetical protein